MSRVTARRSPIALTEAAPAPLPESGSFQTDASRVLHELNQAMAALLAAAPSPTSSCAEVEEAFGIDAMLAWQVLRIARVTDPFAAGIKVPSRVSMTKLLKAAAKRRVPSDVADRVAEAFDTFEKFVELNAGDRDTMRAMLSAYIPEEREKAELAHKEMAFKAMSQLKGVAAETEFWARFQFPSRVTDGVEAAEIAGFMGLRRLRPGAPILYTRGDTGDDPGLTGRNFSTLEGQNALKASPLVPQFSSSPLPRIESWSNGPHNFHSVVDKDVGLRGAVDLVLGNRTQTSISRFRKPGTKTHSNILWQPECPVKRITIDVFIHADLWPGVSPELAIYDTVRDGGVQHIHDPAREHDRMALLESIRPLGPGLANARLPHLPRYMEMLEFVCDKADIDPSRFRGYRLDVQFPIYGAEYMMAFRLPEPHGQ